MDIVEWLVNEEEFIAPKSKFSFIKMNIKQLNRTIDLHKCNKEEGRIGMFNPQVKFIVLLVWIVSLAFVHNMSILIGCMLVELGVLIFITPEQRVRIFNISLLIPLFTLVMVLPAIVYGQTHSILIPIRLFLSIIMTNIYVITTGWATMIKSFRHMHIPEIMIFILEITYKYIFILSRISLNTFYALEKRTIGKKIKRRVWTTIIGNLFMKSYMMSEEVYDAMICRGYTFDSDNKEIENARN